MLQTDTATLGQLWLRRDGAYLRARRMMPPAMPWPLPEARRHELSDELLAVLAEYHWLDEQVRLQRHQVLAMAGSRSG